jgi:hypothetical protein
MSDAKLIVPFAHDENAVNRSRKGENENEGYGEQLDNCEDLRTIIVPPQVSSA